jgi:hypothetical protein
MNSAMRFLPTSASILSSASIGRRTTVGFSCIGGRPMKIIPLKAISLIDEVSNICDIGYISKGRLKMFTKLTLEQLIAELARSQDPLLVYTRQQIKLEILLRRAAVARRTKHMTFQTLTSSSQVREVLAAAGYTQKVAKKDVLGTWVSKDGKTTRVGMSLSKSFKTGQSSQGYGAAWVYRVAL